MIYSPIKSTNLVEASYDEKAQKLYVRFKSGALYEYSNCPSGLWIDFEKTFQSSESSTIFLNTKIKGLPFRRVQ